MIEKCVICPECKNLTLVFWVIGEQQVCCDICWHEKHVQSGNHEVRNKNFSGRLVYFPVKSKEGFWITNKKAITELEAVVDDLREIVALVEKEEGVEK